MKKYISFSGGVESTTMALLFGGSADAIFSDTGWEHKKMYERLETVESEIRKVHPNFKVIKVKNEKYESLQAYIKEQKFFPNIMARYCTRMFKIEPIDKFLKSDEPVELMIGLNADEGDRVGNHGLVKNVTYSYPLLENGITRAACIEILTKANLLPSFPPYMSRGGCVGCFFKTKKEFIAMRLLSPDEFNNVEKLENEVQDQRGKHFAIQSNGHSMAKIRYEADSAMFSAEEMYSKVDDYSTPCGVFCHR